MSFPRIVSFIKGGTIKRIAIYIIVLCLPFMTIGLARARSSYSFSIAPMNQSITLTPGEVYTGSFKVTNPSSNTDELSYKIECKSFYVDDQYNTIYDDMEDSIVSWTEITSGKSGTLQPNESTEVVFLIDVPLDASPGGHYEAFRVISQARDINKDKNEGVAIKEQLVITHLLFAEVPGEALRQGEITEIDVPGFLFDDKIRGESAIKNTGNIHDKAKYALQVFPLFSDEELYTNEEEPETRIILPNRTLNNENVWDETPNAGIFRVIYTVEFAGNVEQVEKIVIKCPLWLLITIIFGGIIVVVCCIYYINKRVKSSINRGEK